MELAIILFIAGVVITAWLYLWVRQQQRLQNPTLDHPQARSVPATESAEAVLVARSPGQLLYVNEQARQWLGTNGSTPDLEYVARHAQPSDSFLSLFAGQTQASFRMGTRWVEAASHTVPAGDETRVVVVMRELGTTAASPDALNLSQTIDIINRIGAMSDASQSVEQVLQLVLTIVSEHIPADAGEICLWDETTQMFYPRGWVGAAAYVLQLAEAGGAYRPTDGITGWIATYQKPVFVGARDDVDAIQPYMPHSAYNSFIGVPLLLEDQLLGTLELAAEISHTFSQKHLALLQAISQQVAIAIHNAELYAQQSRHIEELASLQTVMVQAPTEDYSVAVYRTLHEKLAQLMGADMCGILLYDPQREALLPKLPFYGIPDQVTRQYQIPLPAGSPQHTIWQNHEHWISNDVTDEPLVDQLNLGPLIAVTGVYNTALLPLELANNRIGVIQLSNKPTEGGFTLRDMQTLRILAAQAVVVVENTRLYEQEKLRETEMLGLREITDAIGLFHSEQSLFAEITRRIAQLMNIEKCGILLHDAAQAQLVAHAPFYGVGDELVDNYVIPLVPDSSIDAIWRDGEAWYSNQVSSDRVVIEAGLEAGAEAMGIRQVLFVPLSIGGRRLGMLQAANKHDGASFTDDDVRLLSIFATQAAAIIENARLYRDLEGRAAESEGLRRVAELAGMLLTADEPLTPVLAEVSMLMASPIVWVSMLDGSAGSLVTLPRHSYGVELDQAVIQPVIPGDKGQQAAVSRQPYLHNHVGMVAAGYSALDQAISLSRMLVVPLSVGERSLGELGVANSDAPYNPVSLSLLQSVAVQIATMLDRMTLYDSTGENLNRRLLELDAIARVSNELTMTLDFDQVIESIRQESMRATGATGCCVVTLHPPEAWLQPDEPLIAGRHGADAPGQASLSALEQQALAEPGQPVMVEDAAVEPGLVVPEDMGSALAVGFAYEGAAAGVVQLYHPQAYYFDDRAVEFLRTMGTKAALGYANAQRYQAQISRSEQLRRRVEQLNQISELGQMLQGTTDPVIMLEAIAYSILQSVGFDVVLMLLYDMEQDHYYPVTQAGLPLDVFNRLKEHTLASLTISNLQQPEYLISESYFYPVEQRSHWAQAGDLSALNTAFEGQRSFTGQTGADWHMGDMLLVPLRSSMGALAGLMVLDGPQDNRRPDRMTLEILEIFAHQASTMLENTRLFLDSITNVEQMTQLNEVLESITRELDIESILLAVANGVLQIVPFMRMTAAVVNTEHTSFDVMRISVAADNSLNVAHERQPSLTGTVLGYSYETGRDALFYHDDATIAEYSDLKALYAGTERTSLILPLTVGRERLGAVHIGSDLQQAFGFKEFRTLIRRMINLAAVAIQNARLLEDAVNLRQFNESVVQSIRQGIIVLDQAGNIITVNAYMRELYGWDASANGQPLFDYRPELVAHLQQAVQQTLSQGEQQECLNLRLEMEPQPLVCNVYIYPLGTVQQGRGAVLLLDDLTERTQLQHDVEIRANQLAALTEVSSRITASLDHSEVVSLALSALDRILQYDTLTFWLRHDDFLRLQGAKDYEDDTMPVGVRVRIQAHDRLRRVVEEKQVYSISRLQGWDMLPGEHGAQSWMGVPLVNQGNVVGVIALCKVEPGFYDLQAEQAALAFANQVAVALANADLFREAERRTQRLSLLNRVSVALGQSLDSEDILEIALREIAQVLHVDRGVGISFERDLQIGRVVVEHPRGDRPPDTVIDLQSQEVYQHIRRTVKSLIIEDMAHIEPELTTIAEELAPRNLSAYILIPMAIGGQVIGAFELTPDSPVVLDPEQTDLGRIIANQAAIAIQNTTLLEQTLVRSRELETLLEAAQATSMTLDVNEVYRSVVDLMLQALDMDDCALMTWDDIDNVVEVQVDVNRNQIPERITPTGTRFNLNEYPSKLRALLQREVVVLTPDTTRPGTREHQELLAFDDMVQVLVPLIVRDQAVGLVQLELEAEYRAFTHREVRLALALGSQAATAIENARLSTETANRVEELYIINDLSQAVSATIDLDEMIGVVRTRVPNIADVEEMYLALYDADTEMISFPMYVRNGEDIALPPRALGQDEVSYVIRNRRPLSMGSDYFSPDDLRRSLGITSGEGDVKSYLGVPLIFGDEVLGVLAVRDMHRTRAFGVNSQGILTTIAAQLGATIQNARLFRRINSVNDELSLLNRNLEQAVAARTEELSEERDRIDTLYRITAELARTLDLERVLRSALEMVARAVNADDGVILQINPTTDQLYSRAVLSPAATDYDDIREYVHPVANLAQNLILESAERTIVIDDLTAIPGWDASAVGASSMASALAVLLEINDDILGVMILLSSRRNVFTEAHMRLVLAAANQVAAAINNSDLYYLIRDQAERLGMLVMAEQAEAEKSNAILEGIADGVVLADAAGVIVRFNSAAERILELPQNQVVGRRLARVIGIQGPSVMSWLDAINTWAQSSAQDPATGFLSDQLEYSNKVVNVRLSPVRTENQFLGVVLVFRDVTKEVEVDRMKSAFISNVSHELRTPMTSIKGYADLLMLGAAGEISEAQEQFLSTIKQNADRLSVLVNDLLNISRLDSGEEKLELSKVDLKQLLDSVVFNLQGRLEHERKSIDVALLLPPDLPGLMGDANKLTQVFTNIVDNAFNYTYANGRIEIRAEYTADDVLVTVKDSGIGIPDEFKDRVWDRFGRYEEHALVMDVAGTGLGLPIVRTLVELHKGEVWFESVLGEGTTFFVRLPRNLADRE